MIFHPEYGGLVTGYDVAVSSERGLRSADWSRSLHYVTLSVVLDSGPEWDRWRGVYEGSVTVHYVIPATAPTEEPSPSPAVTRRETPPPRREATTESRSGEGNLPPTVRRFLDRSKPSR